MDVLCFQNHFLRLQEQSLAELKEVRRQHSSIFHFLSNKQSQPVHLSSLNCVICCPNINPDSSCAAVSSHSTEAEQQQVTYIFKTCRRFCLFPVPPFLPQQCSSTATSCMKTSKSTHTGSGRGGAMMIISRRRYKAPKYISAGEIQVLYSMHLTAQCSAHHPGIWPCIVKKSSFKTAYKKAEECIYL